MSFLSKVLNVRRRGSNNKMHQNNNNNNAKVRIGLVRCEHCNRQFNQHSAVRHIPWCARQAATKPKMSKENLEALERYNWRINYKPGIKITKHLTLNTSNTKHQRIDSTGTLLSSASSSSNSSITRVGGKYFRSIFDSSPSTQSNRQKLPKQQQPQKLQQQQQHQIPQRPLKRSISSTTLTKTRDFAIPKIVEFDTKQAENKKQSTQRQQQISRLSAGVKQTSKSVNDLSIRGLLVTFNQRLDELYTQNQLLLERLSCKLDKLSTDETCINQSQANGKALCHYCKSSCLLEAYCQKCGCQTLAEEKRQPVAL